MHSQKGFKPIYGSFSGREDIEVVTKNTPDMPRKVPFNIGFPSIRRVGTKIKVTLPKPQDYGVSYSQAVIRAKQITSSQTAASRQMTQANKIITQTSSTVITNGNRSSTPSKPSITTQVSLGDRPSVDQPSSQVVSSISNKSTPANIQSHPSSPDKSNPSYNTAKNDDGSSSSTLVNGTTNFSGTNCSTSKVPMNMLNGSTFQQNNASNLNEAMKPNSLNVQPQHKNGVAGKVSVWNGINSKVINPIGAMKEISPGSAAVRSQYASYQHQRGNKTLQYGPNTSVASLIPNNSTCTAEKMNNNDFPKEQSHLANVTKHAEQHESDNKNNTSSFTSTPSSSRRSSESNGTTVKESTFKNNAKHKKKNESKTSSGLNTPSQSDTPSDSRRSSTSHSPNTIVVSKEPSVKNVSARQVESDSKNNIPSAANTPNVSSRISESITNQINSNGAVPSNISWANRLFPSKDENQKPNAVIAESSKSMKLPSPPVKPQKPQKPDVLLTNGKPKVGGLAGLLKDFDPSFQNVKMIPRGLINNGNMCFMNAILQTLSHCPPFCNLLTRIYKDVVHSFNSKTPLVDSLVRFIDEYKQTKRTEGSDEFGEAFSPEYVYDALRGLKRFDSMKGRQEDAEEFLGFLLDGLHEEFLAALKKDEPKNQQFDKASEASNQKEDDWMEVGRKNKTSFTRTTNIEETPISRIFGGQFRSVLTCPGSNDSITLQPYQSLQLDIQPDDVKTIGDALKNLTVSECVDDFYSPKSGLVKATKRLYIETLPPILTLHLKRFIYDNVGGTQKLSKHIGYSTTLSIQPEIVAQSRRPNKAIEYQLFGVVYHHGKSATGGHYTADILCQNDWLHIDDTVISPISLEEVASVENPTQPTDRSAYILFYMRS